METVGDGIARRFRAELADDARDAPILNAWRCYFLRAAMSRIEKRYSGTGRVLILRCVS